MSADKLLFKRTQSSNSKQRDDRVLDSNLVEVEHTETKLDDCML